MQTISVARNAMATRFEILLHGDKPSWLRAAGEEVLNEVERLEAQLSLYRPTSEIAHVNARAAREPVRVSPNVFRLLQLAKQLHRETAGAFDITIAPLVRCWGFMGGTGEFPAPGDIEAALQNVGMQHILLSGSDLTVRFDREGVMLDLGAIGKGHAIDCAVELLREVGVTSALLHGGTSTIYGLGHPPDAEHWKVALDYPETEGEQSARRHLATVTLRDEAVSVSAIWGRSFKKDGRTYGHVLDPRTGQPVCGTMMTAVALASATETDALSTAMLVAGETGYETISSLRPGMRSLVLSENIAGEDDYRIESKGIPKLR